VGSSASLQHVLIQCMLTSVMYSLGFNNCYYRFLFSAVIADYVLLVYLNTAINQMPTHSLIGLLINININ